ncbi:MAG: hypothetical protein Q7U36_01730, partial [bacterium]|nr:hypothetical protein [bacterium]
MRLKINKNSLLFLFPIITLLFVLTSNKAYAYTCTWTGTSSTAWATAGNWSGCNSTIPQTTDDVVINTTGNQPILDLTGGKTINSLSIGSSAVSTLTLSNGLVDIDVNKLTITNNLTIGGSGTITSTANTTAQTHSVNMAVGGNVDIATNGKIDVSSKGYSGGTSGHTTGYGTGGGAGGATNTYGAGGGYGGAGGGSSMLPAGGGPENGQANIHQPTDLGSGGGYGNTNGGAGGGAIKLTISGTFTNSGSILATGANSILHGSNYASGAGSGGSIWISAGTIAGAGTISANGGNGLVPFGYSGSGSGGRIAITYTADNNSNFTKTAFGGTIGSVGASGSIYIDDIDDAYSPDLTFNNNGNNSPTRTISATYGVTTFRNLIFSEGTAGFINSGTNLVIHSTGTLTFGGNFSNTGTITANSLATLNFNGGTSTNSGNFSATSLQNLNITGATVAMDTLYVDNEGVYTCTGTSRYTLPATYSMNISSSGTLNHTANPAGSTPVYCLNLSMTNLTIDGTSAVNVNARGYLGGTVANATGYGTGGGIFDETSGGGAGHGGVGGRGTRIGSIGGSEYQQTSLDQPFDLGSGGGYSGRSGYNGGAGGGSIKLNISGTLNHGGSILSNGGNGIGYSSTNFSGGGSGGSIWIQVGLIAGSGTITANGGVGGIYSGGYYGGGGAGGRIAIHGTGAGVLTPTAIGGIGWNNLYGGTGTVYYNVTGTYTFSVMDFTVARDFTTLAFNKTTTADSISTPTLTVDARAGNATDTNDSSWTAWQTNISSNVSDNLNPFDNK